MGYYIWYAFHSTLLGLHLLNSFICVESEKEKQNWVSVFHEVVGSFIGKDGSTELGLLTIASRATQNKQASDEGMDSEIMMFRLLIFGRL